MRLLYLLPLLSVSVFARNEQERLLSSLEDRSGNVAPNTKESLSSNNRNSDEERRHSTHSTEEDEDTEQEDLRLDQEEESDDILRQSGALIAGAYLKCDRVDEIAKLVIQITKSNQVNQEFGKGVLRNSGRQLCKDKGDLLSFLQMIIREKVPSHALSMILEVSNMKLAFPSVISQLQDILIGITELSYFVQVTMSLGNYFGWILYNYYFSGKHISAKLSDEQLVIVRLMAAINTGDFLDIADIVKLVTDGKFPKERFREIIKLVVLECIEVLTKIPGMFRMIKSLLEVEGINKIFTDALKVDLAIQYVENIAVRRRKGLREAFTELIKFNDETVVAGILDHLTRKDISTAENISGFVKSMVHNDLPSFLLSNYLFQLEMIPDKVIQLSHGLAENLSSITEAEKFTTFIEIISTKGNKQPHEMLELVKKSDIEGCNRSIGIIHFSIGSDDENSLKSTLDSISFRKCPSKRLLEGIELSLKLYENSKSYARLAQIISNSRPLTNPKVRTYVVANPKKFPSLNDALKSMKSPRKTIQKSGESSRSKARKTSPLKIINSKAKHALGEQSKDAPEKTGFLRQFVNYFPRLVASKQEQKGDKSQNSHKPKSAVTRRPKIKLV